jgi:hypothetical protein
MIDGAQSGRLCFIGSGFNTPIVAGANFIRSVDVLKSAALRGQIARFLHKHKDEESVADSVSKPNMTKGMPRGT